MFEVRILSAFQRRLLVDYGPPIGRVYVHSPEDLILYKLMYLGLSGQPKHARDISAILIDVSDKHRINGRVAIFLKERAFEGARI